MAKLFTNQGKPVARFTMLCTWKNEYQKVNTATAEIYQKWTYRSDLVEAEYIKRGQQMATPIDYIRAKYMAIRHRAIEIKIFDNALPVGEQLYFHQVNRNILLNKFVN